MTPRTPALSAALFDLDGTLSDPAVGITRCIRHALETLGHEIPAAESLFRFIGPPLRETFATLLAPGNPAAIEKAVALYRERFGEIGLFENRIYPGIRELLARLEELDYRILLATSKPIVYADRILRHFSIADHFEAVYGPELDGHNDNKTEMVRFLLREERLDPAGTALVGDRRQDMEAARQNGLFAIGVAYGFGSETELASAGADLVVRDPAALRSLLERARAEADTPHKE
ncbi:MAG: HAD hydrolase-like protein [Myxococcota bacterium]|nr:HAD hydrolase-like protein [Myxococcota bacterium]